MDSKRVSEVLNSNTNIEVLHRGAPVWIEELEDNNTALVTYIDSHMSDRVPVYELVENRPVMH